MCGNFLRYILCLAASATFAAAVRAEPDSSNETDKTETVAISTGIGVTNPYAVYGYFGAVIAPPSTGLDQSGFRIRLGTVDGQFSYPSEDTGSRIYGLGKEASVLFGYSFNHNDTSLLVLAGPTIQNIRLSAQDPTNPAQSTAMGTKFLSELYSTPTKNSKIDVEAVYATTFKSYFVRIDPGYDFRGDGIYVGPKAMFLGDEHYRQWRVGASVSGFKFGNTELGFNGGYLRDRQQGGGLFAGLDLYIRY
jgi:Cellulose biosynthesis protein BcsS